MDSFQIGKEKGRWVDIPASLQPLSRALLERLLFEPQGTVEAESVLRKYSILTSSSLQIRPLRAEDCLWL